MTRSVLHRGGTVASTTGSLRALLDAALSSPSGRGVVADADGRLVGTIRAAEVIPAIEARRDAASSGAPASSGAGTGATDSGSERPAEEATAR